MAALKGQHIRIRQPCGLGTIQTASVSLDLLRPPAGKPEPRLDCASKPDDAQESLVEMAKKQAADVAILIDTQGNCQRESLCGAGVESCKPHHVYLVIVNRVHAHPIVVSCDLGDVRAEVVTRWLENGGLTRQLLIPEPADENNQLCKVSLPSPGYANVLSSSQRGRFLVLRDTGEMVAPASKAVSSQRGRFLGLRDTPGTVLIPAGSTVTFRHSLWDRGCSFKTSSCSPPCPMLFQPACPKHANHGRYWYLAGLAGLVPAGALLAGVGAGLQAVPDGSCVGGAPPSDARCRNFYDGNHGPGLGLIIGGASLITLGLISAGLGHHFAVQGWEVSP